MEPAFKKFALIVTPSAPTVIMSAPVDGDLIESLLLTVIQAAAKPPSPPTAICDPLYKWPTTETVVIAPEDPLSYFSCVEVIPSARTVL